MKISQLLNSGKPFPSLEIVPPLRGLTKDELTASIAPLMEFAPKYINVTNHREEYGFVRLPDGSFRREVVRSRVSPVAVCATIMSSFHVEVVPHIICGGFTAEQIDSQLKDFHFMGIENVMSLLGEKRFTPEVGGYSHADELVRDIRRSYNYCIGVGAYPEKHFEAPNMETDIANLRRKVAAGADYVITQMFFDNGAFYDFRDRCREAGITVPIIPGLKPLTNMRQIEVLPKTFSIDIPVELTGELKRYSDDPEAVRRTGIRWCISQCKDLLAHGVPCVHFYTMGRSEAVSAVLKECF